MDGTITINRTLEDWRSWPWGAITAIVALLVALYWDVVPAMVQVWMDDPAYSHGILIPPLAAYVAWLQRDEILAARPETDYSGLFLTAVGCAALFVGKLGAELFLSRISLVFILAGMIWTFWGRRRFWASVFPLFLLATMVPIPTIVYNKLAAPLQLFASWVASQTLETFGIAVFRDGNVMHLPEISLGVAEACSGLRSISSLSVLALVIGYFTCRKISTKALLFFLSFPTAIFINVFRIVVTALFARQDPELAEGFFHSFSGWIVFLFGFGLLYLIALLLGRLEDGWRGGQGAPA